LRGLIICHTHWDREWFAPSSITNRWLVRLFENLAILFNQPKNSNLTFLLDGQTLIIEDFLNTCKDEKLKKTVKELIEQKRIILGPIYAQIDFRIAHEASIMKNIELGIKVSNEFYKYEPTDVVAWMVDNFGFPGQLPQILRIYNIDKAVIWRGVNGTPEIEKKWVGSDGSTIKTVFLVGGYRNLYNLTSTREYADQRFELEIEKLSELSISGNIPLLDGYDLDTNPENPKNFLKNKLAVLSKPQDLFDNFDSIKPSVIYREQLSGKYACTFPGTLSTRIYLKQLAYYVEKILNTAQFLNWFVTEKIDLDVLWKELLKNLIHDNISGVGIDFVHSDMEKTLKKLYKTTLKIVSQNLKKLMDNSNLTSGYYTLNLFNGEYDTWYSTEKYHFKLRTDGTSISKIELKRNKKSNLENTSEIIWKNNYYEARIDETGTLRIRNPYNNKVEYYVSYMLEKELGDTYTTVRKPILFKLHPEGLKVDFSSEHNLVISQKRRLVSEDIDITINEKLIFDETPVIKLKITTLNEKGQNYVLSLITNFQENINEVFAKMPFEIVRRPITEENKIDDETYEKIKGVLLAAREVGINNVFPFQGFVGVETSQGMFSLFARGIKEYTSFSKEIGVTLLRSVDWIAKENIENRTGDAGPMIYVPEANLLGREMNFEVGLYLNAFKDIKELYKWFSLFDNPPIIFKYSSKEKRFISKNLHVKLLKVKTPWIPISDDEIVIFNPFQEHLEVLRSYAIKKTSVDKFIERSTWQTDERLQHSSSRIAILDILGKNYKFNNRKNAKFSKNRIANIKLINDILQQINTENTEKAKLRSVVTTTKCEYLMLKHKNTTLKRKELELIISKMLIKKKPKQIEDVLWKFNKLRSKRRVLDYLVELCNSQKLDNNL